MTDVQLHYIEQGQGQPLILLHGNGESCDYFEHQIAYFSKQYHVIALDTRGHGQSPRGENRSRLNNSPRTCTISWMKIPLKKPSS